MNDLTLPLLSGLNRYLMAEVRLASVVPCPEFLAWNFWLTDSVEELDSIFCVEELYIIAMITHLTNAHYQVLKEKLLKKKKR